MQDADRVTWVAHNFRRSARRRRERAEYLVAKANQLLDASNHRIAISDAQLAGQPAGNKKGLPEATS
jgi:hypothetical protein